jgi:hypothetical protein
MPREEKNQNSELFYRKTDEVSGCLQLWVFKTKLGLYTALLRAIQCLECASMTHFLFKSRTIEADSRTQETEVGVRAHSRQPISLLIALNVAVTWHPKQSHLQ